MTERLETRVETQKRARAYLASLREEAVEGGAGPTEVGLLAYCESLMGLLYAYTQAGKDEAWLRGKWQRHQLEFFSSMFEDGGQPHEFLGTIVRIFSDGYAGWTEREFGKRRPYVPTSYDLEAVAKEIIPYLRQRGEGKAKRALEVWEEICQNYFHSDFSQWRARNHLLKDVPAWLQVLEVGPVGRDDDVEELDDTVRAVVEKFASHKPDGKWTVKEAKALITRAGSVEEAIAGLDWIYSAECPDEYLRKNRPFTLGFVVRVWDRFEGSRPTKAQLDRKERAKQKFLGQLRVVSG